MADLPPITSFHYEAFISYRHASPDDKIAEALHRALEEYVVPRSLVKRGFPRRLSRVFRDREELPTSNSLTDGIRDALAKSRVLIVVCSWRTPSSKWIAKEIEIFKSLGRNGQILSLLIDGEPEESFPPLLREARQIITTQDGATSEQVEEISPLAADIRAGSESESLRLLKNEKLRLLAPILGCSFDDLKQRHRQRTIRRLRIAFASSILGIVAAAATGFWYWTAHDEIRTEYYANFTKQWGAAKGVGRLTPEQASHRENSLKFYVRGKRVEGFDVVNGYGGMTVNNMVGTFIGETDTSNDAKRDFHYEWEYNTEGRVTKELAFDRAHRMVWAFIYNAGSADIGHYADKNGYPRPRTGSGADYVQFTRNAEGYETQLLFTDSKGDAEPNHEGVFGWKYVLDSNGMAVEESNLNRDGQLMLNHYGYARATYRRDSLGNTVESRFFGVDGKPIYEKYGFAKQTTSFDQYGRRVEVKFWDQGDKPAVLAGGYSEVTYAYDLRGDETERAYRDAAGKPAAKPGDFARITYTYDDHGHMIRMGWWEADNKPWKAKDGHSQLSFEYDANGYQKSQTFLNADGKKVLSDKGYAKIAWTHDDQGNENQLSLFGLDDKPVIGPGGFSSMKRKFNSHFEQIEETYYGLRGERVVSKRGIAKTTSKYDESGSGIQESYWDLKDRPVLSTDGYASISVVRNEHGQIAETSFYGTDGAPILIPDGYAKIDRKYDDRDNQIESIYYGVNGKPRLTKNGFARVTRTYDQSDRPIEVAYWGAAGERVTAKVGYARLVYTYDERGKVTSTEKFDSTGKSLGKETPASE
ncbi:MAG: toll/interleukin-1 receptor domain-containing protein [Candidatus Acidiferrales bacterium]